jgi:hypothetical protein
VLYKKRWSDGLHDDFEHLNEFELKFGLFGGDGGGSSGGGSTTSNKYSASDQEPEPGRPSSPAPAPQSFSPQSSISAGPQANFGNVNTSSGFAPGLADIAPGAMVDTAPTAAPGPSPSAAQQSAFSSAPSFSMPSLADISMAAPSISAPSMSAPTSVGQAIANAQNLGFGSVPGTDTFGYNTQVGPGTLGIGTNLSGDIGLGYSMKFAKGGEVHQGIGSLMRRR